MPTAEYFRGHKIVEVGGQWLFCDTVEVVENAWTRRPCGFCGRDNTPDNHDGCIGTLRGVMNACCGHGESRLAYVQFTNGLRISNQTAITFLATYHEAAEAAPRTLTPEP